jgi:hypothetical protein
MDVLHVSGGRSTDDPRGVAWIIRDSGTEKKSSRFWGTQKTNLPTKRFDPFPTPYFLLIPSIVLFAAEFDLLMTRLNLQVVQEKKFHIDF